MKHARQQATKPQAPLAQRSPQLKFSAELRPEQQYALEQSQSLLFQLPYEMRQMIWKDAICGKVVHIAHQSNRLVNIVCSLEDTFELVRNTGQHKCWFALDLKYPARLKSSKSRCEKRRYSSAFRSMGISGYEIVFNANRLLLTCRKM